MKPAEGDIAIGTVLVGKYRVESILGQGGAGVVYKAHHLTLDEPVAIKVLRRDVVVDQDALQRFIREAQAAVKLKSEHVARVTDVGTFEDDVPYMVMEYLDGTDLGALVDQNGAVVAPVAVDLVLQACDAIAEAHSLGIVHRDIKPSNLFVAFRPDQTPVVKVLDFGISKTATGADLSLTQTQSMLGTPAYMSPEQMRSARMVDARTDIWSLGTVLYELLEGRMPFQAESFSEMCVMVAIDPHPPLVNAPELQPVIDRCLAKRPEDRYANVAELAYDLARFAGNFEAARHYTMRTHRVLGLRPPTSFESSPVIPRPRDSAPMLPMATAAPTFVGAGDSTAPVNLRRSRGPWLGVLLALVLGVGGGLAVMAATRSDEPQAQASSREDAGAPRIEATLPAVDAAASTTSAGSADAGAGSADVAAGSGSETAGAGSGSATVARPPETTPAVATKPPVKKPPVKKPPMKKPPVKKPPAEPAVATPPPKKCDPFSSRTKC